jgi:hypothetical protein
MLITCCTDTYFKWGELFLRSFKATNDNNIPIHINGMKLSQEQMKSLKNIYPNLTIKNRQYDEKEVAEKYGVTIDDVRRCSDAVSRGFKHKCRWWMDFIVVDGRISWLYDTLLKNKNQPWWLHIDIDLMFRDSIQPLIDKILINDVVCRFRPNRSFIKRPPNKPEREVTDDMKIAGGMVGLKGENGIRFVKRWVDEIKSKTHKDFDEPNVKGRNQGWGQTTLYYAYRHFENLFRWEQIEEKWLVAGCNLNNPIWCGHRKGGSITYRGNKRGIGDRHKLRDIFFEELKLVEENKQHDWRKSS